MRTSLTNLTNNPAPKQSTAPAQEIKSTPFIFPSLAFPPEKRVLRVNEVAERFLCTKEHVINLLEEGQLAGVDISGRFEFLCVPTTAVDALAARCQLPREEVLKILETATPAKKMARRHWRILNKEGFERFLARNHSRVDL